MDAGLFYPKTMKRNSFNFNRSVWESISALPEQMQLQFFKAVVRYALDGIEPDFANAICNALWIGLKGLLVTERHQQTREITTEKTAEEGIDAFITPGSARARARRIFAGDYITGNKPFPQEAADKLRKLDYSEFLKTPYWKTVGEAVKSRAGWRCENCGETRNLQVHHKTYEHHGDEIHHLQDLVCLCRECHAKVHQAAETAPISL